MAAMYYAESADHHAQPENQIKSPSFAKDAENPYDARGREELPSFLSPLNFSKLAIGGDSKEQSIEEEERQEQKSIVILETVLSNNNNQDQIQRDSLFGSNLISGSKERETLSMRISSQSQTDQKASSMKHMSTDKKEGSSENTASSETQDRKKSKQSGSHEGHSSELQTDRGDFSPRAHIHEDYGEPHTLRKLKSPRPNDNADEVIKSPQDDPSPEPADALHDERPSAIVDMPSEFPCPSASAVSKAEDLKKVMKQEFMMRLNSMKQTGQPQGAVASNSQGVQLPPPSMQRKSNEELNKKKVKR